jgi:hypothetical protein
MADEEGIPLPPLEAPEPVPPITPEPPTVTPPVEQTTAPAPPTTPAPPSEPEIPDVGSGGGGFPDLLDFAALLIVLGILALLAYMTGLANFILKLAWSAFGRGGSAPQISTVQFGQPVANQLAPYVTGLDAKLGADFMLQAGIVARVGRAILAAEETIYHVLVRLLPLEGQAANQERLSSHLSNRLSHQEAAQQAQQRQAALAKVQAQQRAHGLDQRLRALETHITTLIDPELDQLRHRIPELEKGATIAWDEIKSHSEALGLTGLTLGTAAALARLGGSWIRCDNAQEIGNQMCGPTGNSLARLLAGALPLLAFADVCAVIKGATALAESGAVQDSLGFGIDAVDSLLECTNSERAAPLNSAYYAPGPLTALGAAGSLNV